MIRSVWVKNQNGKYLELDLRTSGDDLGVLIFNLEGLGSPNAAINSTGGPSFDGARVNSVRAEARNIVLSLAIPVQGEKEEEAKALIYEFFPVKQEITLGIRTDVRDVYTKAYVETSEFNQFTKVENVTVSMVCPEPYMVDMSEREINITPDSGIPLFSFPFSNESLIYNTIEMGWLTDIPSGFLSYSDGVSAGAQIDLLFLENAGNVTIRNNNGSQMMTIDISLAEAHFGSPIQAGDRIEIDTRIGQKSITFIRDNTYLNYINAVGIGDDWIQIRPGGNYIVVSTEGPLYDTVETGVRFNPLREGV